MSRSFAIANLLFVLGIAAAVIAVVAGVIIYFAVRNSRKTNYNTNPPPIQEPEVRSEQRELIKSFGETLKELRTEHNMTQEFVAESLGVTRQAVSKWENGTSEPSTTNLIAIAKLYGIAPEELLKRLIK